MTKLDLLLHTRYIRFCKMIIFTGVIFGVHLPTEGSLAQAHAHRHFAFYVCNWPLHYNIIEMKMMKPFDTSHFFVLDASHGNTADSESTISAQPFHILLDASLPVESANTLQKKISPLLIVLFF